MSDRRKAAQLDGALKGLFQGLEARPAPEHVLRVVDLLEAAAAESDAEPDGEEP